MLLFRRLWLPLPLTKRTCGCGRLLDSSGHHRAACANVGVLGRRGFALESAAARVCREAGGRVSVNQYVRDLDIAAPTQPKTADWRWLQISLCSMACSWPSTPRWFPLSVAQGFLMQGVLMSMGQRPWQHEEGNSGWRERMDMRGWWSLRVRLEGDLRGMSPLPPPVVHV